MRFRFPAACLCAFLLAACATTAPEPDRPATITVSLVGTNDLHGAVTASSGRGGLALLDGYLRNLRAARAADRGAVLLVDAGDLFQGTLESNLNEGAAVIAAYNAMGYTASAIGNHEFDFGPAGAAATPSSSRDDPRGALKARAREARFPFLAANLVDARTERPVHWPNVHPSIVVNADGVRVGLVGLGTEQTLQLTIAANTTGLAIAPLASTLTRVATRVRREGASLVIATVHAGGRCATRDDPRDLSSCRGEEEIFKLARALPPGLVDAIVAGHSHQMVAHEVAGIPIIESYASGRAFGRIDFTMDRSTGRVRDHRIFPAQEIVPGEYEGRPVVPTGTIDAILAPAVDRARVVKAMPLNAEIAEPLARAVSEESQVGNLEADWMRATVPDADIAITNGGGLRADLPSGRLTYGRLYELIPFDNREVIATITGAELRRVIGHNLQQGGSVLVVSGIRTVARCDGSDLTVDIRRPSGALVADTEPLTVVTTDFLATGGDDFFAPIMPLRTIVKDGPIVREHIAQWLTATGGRWTAADVLTPATRRLVYPGERPISCAGPAPEAAPR